MALGFDALVFAPVGAIGTGPAILPISPLTGYFLPSAENIGKQMYYVLYKDSDREWGIGTLGFSELQYTLSRGMIKSTTGAPLNITTSGQIAIGDVGPEALAIVNIYDATENAITVDKVTIGGVELTSGHNQPYGHTISNNDSDPDNDLNFDAGQQWTWDKSKLLIGAGMTKRFDAPWAAGTTNGGLDAGSLPTDGIVYLYSIYHPANGVDYLGSTADPATGPSLPVGYTDYAYLGFRPTDASGHFISVAQSGNIHQINGAIDIAFATNPGTSNHDIATPFPTGCLLGVRIYMEASTGGSKNLYLGTPPATVERGAAYVNPTAGISNKICDTKDSVVVGASNEIRYRAEASTADFVVYMNAAYWMDPLIQ